MEEKRKKMKWLNSIQHKIPHENENQQTIRTTKTNEKGKIAIKNHMTQLLQAFSGYFKR